MAGNFGNVDNFDFSSIVNAHSDEVRQYNEAAYQRSVRVSKQEYDKKKAKCKSNFKNRAITTILAVALAAGVTIGGVKTIKNFNNSTEIMQVLGNTVTGNKVFTGGYDANNQREWYLNTDEIAEDILNQNRQYDIDTRIYGCYVALDEFNKDIHMQRIYDDMKDIVAASPDKYDESEKYACSFDSFKDYISSKGLTIEEFLSKMKSIVSKYADESIAQKDISSMLNDLNEDTGRGGSR